MEATSTLTLSQIQQSVRDLQAGQYYFHDILNSQLIIFSLIVTALVAFYFLFNWKVSRDQISGAILASMKKVREETKQEIEKELEDKNKQLSDRIDAQLSAHSGEIKGVRAQVYRTLGQFWDSQKSYSVAFIWWMRAASEFATAEDEDLVRISLGNAKKSVEKVAFGFNLDYETIGEYQRIVSEIDNKKFEIEKNLLDQALKSVLSKNKDTTTN